MQDGICGGGYGPSTRRPQRSRPSDIQHNLVTRKELPDAVIIEAASTIQYREDQVITSRTKLQSRYHCTTKMNHQWVVDCRLVHPSSETSFAYPPTSLLLPPLQTTTQVTSQYILQTKPLSPCARSLSWPPSALPPLALPQVRTY